MEADKKLAITPRLPCFYCTKTNTIHKKTTKTFDVFYCFDCGGTFHKIK